ncbi:MULTISPECIES: type II secretion system F family protein [Nitrosomonas]|uniref:Bacterial type II secretion system protein n=1 Tax=Nitrosomonas europaea (strain ATCC 19718 / CIP 103999 / KCTC 2705 / NBRC 14298) TaxID=228410 RepID=Q82WR6_NITEU|nr:MULTISPECIES: type II secretion system F family protein [Nitrosomonas]KXK41411.1 MAG: type II secretion system protein [Nitrosomonas europaea]QOJ09162.1 MAG: type II secretion system F family protein [Nitrosomonas sp. H1_AOB3]CAD84507.1 Bacterial type II secretion system protein [Nitrosomonas europaea ATCC 19718]SDW04125.1 type IV pilus assembly protein PilC [Nitrosomonas europaea]SES67956.1 type IV pilus assembly protein PilC [Nitrosomonas europaea]
MATVAASEKKIKEFNFLWEGKDKAGKAVKGEMRAAGTVVVTSTLRRQGIRVTKITKARAGGKITDKDITLFTRQLATMMKSGVPLLQAFDIVGKGHSNRAVGKLLMDIKSDVETGNSLANAFRKHPLYFDSLFCNLVAAGEAAGILDSLLDRLATYKEKIQAIKGKIKSALFYPISIIVVAFVITAVIMIFVIPAFKELFQGFGADLPAPTLMVMAISDFFVDYWWAIFGCVGGGLYAFFYTWKRSTVMQHVMDRLALRLPIFGEVIRKATIARWSRTLSTMFAAGVPLVEALNSVAGAAGNQVYFEATRNIQNEVSTGSSLVDAMTATNVFPSMVLQMVSIGEESGSLDAMLSKIADFFEAEVDDAVEALSSLMEPIIMVVLGTLIGGMVVAMYLPIFKMGQVVG